MAKDLDFAVGQGEAHGGLVAHVGLDASSNSTTAVSKLLKVWENRQAQQAARAGGLGLMAVSLAACGGSSTTTTTTTATTPAQSTALTASPESVSFSGTLSAARAYTPGGNNLVNTLQTDDTITGTGSADVINVTFGNNNDAGAATVAPTMSGVETINFTNVSSNGAVDILDMSNVTGTTAVNVSSLSDDTIIRGIDSISIALKAFNVSDEAADVAFEFDDTVVSGSANAVAVTVDNFNGAELNIGAGATEAADGTGVETLNLTASGAASTIANLGSTGNEVINVVATADLTITAMSATGVTALNLTGSTASTSINAAGNVGANEFTYTGGAGNDTLIINSGFAGTDTLAAGLGTDTLSIRATADVAAVGALNSSDAAVATGWETLDLRGASITGAGAVDFTVDMDHLPGVTAISMRAADDDTKAVFTLNDLTQAQAENLSVLHTGTDADTDSEIIVDMKVNGTDTVKLSATVSADTQVVELNDANDNIENAEITLAGAAATNLDVDLTSFLTSLTVSGGVAGETLTITNAHTSATVNMAAVVSDVTMTLGAGTQTATFGSGDDTITMAAGVKTVNTGAGDDTVSTTVALLGTAASSWDSINAGLGTDTLLLTEMAAVSAEAAAGISGFERLKVDASADPGADATINMAVFSSPISRITVGDTHDDVLTFSNIAAGFSDLRFDADAENDTEATLTRAVDSAANAMVVTITGGETVKTLNLNDEETITISSSSTGAATISTLTSTDLTSLTLTGSGNVIITNAIGGGTAITAVNASNLSAAATVNASNSTAAITATGNSLAGGIFTFTGGSGNDSITGGLAGDTLSGGAGTDTISGGAGDDRIDGGDGADTLSGGTGSDTFVYTAATVGTRGADILADFVGGTGGDVIEIDIATGTTTVFSETSGDLGSNGAGNADVLIITGGRVVDVSGNAAADLAAINDLLMDADNDAAAADAEIMVVFNADTNGDGAADQIQVWWAHETGAAASTFDDAAQIGYFQNLAGNTDLAGDFVAANFTFV